MLVIPWIEEAEENPPGQPVDRWAAVFAVALYCPFSVSPRQKIRQLTPV